MVKIKPSDLIGVKNNPQGYEAMRNQSRMAKAYHNLNPYPAYSPMTKDWKTEERGPFPRCLPFPRHIVEKGARWLFGKPLAFRVEEDDALSELLNDVWTSNDMGRRSLALATFGAQCGGCALKWSHDPDQAQAVRLHVLDASEHVRFYFDPGDTGTLLMARIQYPYFDPVSNKWWWYREDITDQELCTYKPIPSTEIYGGPNDDPYTVVEKADVFDKWEEDKRGPNEFGIINVWYLRNKETGRELGEGDLWACLHVIDQINFAYDLAHKHNQKSLDPQKALIDLTGEPDEAPGPDMPGSPDTFHTVDNAPAQGKIELLQPSAEMRASLKEFSDDLLRMVYDLVGSVQLKTEDITNKGNLTSAVLTQLYAPLIETTEDKRKCYGEDGLGKFFERMSLGLMNIGVAGWSEAEDVQIHWPQYFEKTEDEQMMGSQKRVFQVTGGLKTHEHAIREQAAADGVIDHDRYLKEVKDEHPDPPGTEKEEEETSK